MLGHKTSRIAVVVKWVLWGGAVLVLCAGIWRLESERATVDQSTILTPDGPVSLYYNGASPSGPLVFVTHGFAGSQQMMQYISRDIARGGFTVAAFDFYGQGRSPKRMSSDVSRIEGTTQQLVGQTLEMIEAIQTATGQVGPIALVGHSMATDIIIRAAREHGGAAAIVAISMYSDAITAEFPARLLVLSGEWEGRLRDVGRDAVAQLSGAAVEGITAVNGAVIRRAVSVPRTEHVGVLYSPVTLNETRDWLQQAFDLPAGQSAPSQGLSIAMVLSALVVLIWPFSKVLPQQEIAVCRVPAITSVAVMILPAVPAVLAALVLGGSVFGLAAFGSLIVFFVVWGAAALFLLIRSGKRLKKPHIGGIAVLLFWALGVFAIALDRYAASFLPTGPRFALMCSLMAGTIPFMIVDRILISGASLWQRIGARTMPIVALSVCMIAPAGNMGLLFTVLPVMVLFYAVYGTMGRAVAQRVGPEAAGVGQGIILAWSIAASTPLFVI